MGFSINNASANHLPGANITWTCNPSNPLEYTITLELYRLCPGTLGSFMNNVTTITNSCGFTNPSTPRWTHVGTPIDVNQLCPSATSNCGAGSDPGVWLFTYVLSAGWPDTTLTLPGDCDNWKIEFEFCCRNGPTNLWTNTPGNFGLNMIGASATLNTLTAPCNNSPTVTSGAIPYACAGIDFNYCIATQDIEGDSVAFAMVLPEGTFVGSPITHFAPYTAAVPLTGFVLDPVTGCFTFNEPTVGNYVVAIQVNSYDSIGQLISSFPYDFQVIVLACTNAPPTNPVSGITNFTGAGTQIDSNTFEACFGDTVCFDVVFQDADAGDTLTIVQDGTTLLPNSTFTQTGINPITGTFCWVAQPGYLGNVMTFTANDNACPIVGITSFAVDFEIGDGVYTGPDQIICGSQTAQLEAFGASSYTWTPTSTLSCSACSNPIASPSVTTTYTVTGNLTGSCPNVSTVTVSVLAALTSSLSTSICQGDSSLIGGVYQNSSGVYNDTLTSIGGCDSVVVTTLSVNPTYLIPQVQSICEGDSILVDSTYYSATGIYDDTLSSSLGCDSIIRVTLTVNPAYVTPETINVCTGDSVSIGGVYYSTSGEYDDTLSTTLGCDSIIRVTLTVASQFVLNFSSSICSGDSSYIGGSYQTTSGIYTDSLIASGGCDSIRITNLTVGATNSSSADTSLCFGDSILLNGAYQTTTGLYVDSFLNVENCDSVVTTNLTVSSPLSVQMSNDTTIMSGATAILTASGGTTYSWSTGQAGSSISVSPTTTTSYWVNVSDSLGCINNAQVTVTVLPEEYAVYVPNVFSISSENLEHNRLYVYGRGVESLELKIYNRWGGNVYETNDASAATRSDGQCCSYGIGWDGTYKQTGEPLNSAVFAYTLAGFFSNGTEFYDSGNITLTK